MKNRLCTPILIIAFAILFTLFSESASDSALMALKNCIQRIIPSLFPFMVMSSMIVQSGAADILGRLLPISKLYSLPVCASAPIIIGAVCGFPLGAKAATELYEKGYINKTETEILISISNNAGPSFLIFVIGANYWNDIKFGIFLYISQIICSVISSLIINSLLFPIKGNNKEKYSSTEITNIAESLSESISSASISSLKICGYITFFNVLNTVISQLFISLPVNIKLFILSVLEFSDAALASSVYKSMFSIFICGFAIGWSGLSVFCQTKAFTTSLHLSLKRCILTKLLQGILMGISAVIYSYLSSSLTLTDSMLSDYETMFCIIISIILTLSILCVFYIIKKRKGA